MNRDSDFDRIFYPRTVAVVGASGEPGRPGYQFMRTLLEFGYRGKLYPVNPEAPEEILGFRTYPNVRDVPDVIDFAFVTVPAAAVPGVIGDCVAKGVAGVEVFTSGFREVGEEGRKLEEEMVKLAKGKLRIIGPNCFGVYCPRGGLTLLPGARLPSESGDVAFISQSGGLALYFAWAASGCGLRFSKVISYGNACDLNESDFVEYFSGDEETKIIAAYLEGVKDGSRFFRLVRGLLGKKPVILWKGGLTQTGGRAVSSHTGSLAGDKAVWRAFSYQTGAVLVDDFEELVDAVLFFRQCRRNVDRRVAVIGGGGAVGVAAGDICERVGLVVPPAPVELQQQLRALLPPVGTSTRNPFDIGAPVLPAPLFRKVLELLLAWEGIDAVIIDRVYLYGLGGLNGVPESGCAERLEVVLDLQRRTDKQFVVVTEELTTAADKIEAEVERRWAQQRLFDGGVAFAPSLTRAATALARVCWYQDKVRSLLAEV